MEAERTSRRGAGARAKRIRLFLTDVDGVLTDGKTYNFIDSSGREIELKGMDTQDGIALVWLAQRGILTGLISGRRSEGLAARAKRIGMSFIVQGKVRKIPDFERILRKARLRPEQAAFVGDDLQDIPLMRRVGWAAAVANARPEVKRAAHTVLRARGGAGAIREAAETILKAQGHWKGILESFEA